MQRLAVYGLRLPRLALLGAVTFFLVGHWNEAFANARFSDASLDGNYAITDIARGSQPPQAGLGIVRYDGKGTLSGTTIQNVPGPMFGKRMFVQASLTGTYVVKEDGTGSSNLIISLPGGFREEMKMAMVITKTEKVDGHETAREVFRADPPRAV